MPVPGFRVMSSFGFQGLDQPEGGGTAKARAPGQLGRAPFRVARIEEADYAQRALHRLDQGAAAGLVQIGVVGVHHRVFGVCSHASIVL